MLNCNALKPDKNTGKLRLLVLPKILCPPIVYQIVANNYILLKPDLRNLHGVYNQLFLQVFCKPDSNPPQKRWAIAPLKV